MASIFASEPVLDFINVFNNDFATLFPENAVKGKGFISVLQLEKILHQAQDKQDSALPLSKTTFSKSQVNTDVDFNCLTCFALLCSLMNIYCFFR